MVVKAATNNLDDIPESLRRYAWQLKEDGRLPLTVGKRYVVSGVRYTRGYSFFLIIADENEFTARPWWYPDTLFTVIDKNEPSDWVEGGTEQDRYFSFHELAKDNTGDFENSLEDGEPEEVAIFLKYYEKYARMHDLWYVDGRPDIPRDEWEKPSSLPKEEMMRRYEEGLKLAKERGYEMPEKPE